MSDKSSAHVAPGTIPPGKPTTTASKVMETGTDMLQEMQPIKHIGQHVCTLALHAHDLSRQITTHHFPSRLNQDFLQCPVYDSEDRLIGIEYVVSDRIFNSLDKNEQKLWHCRVNPDLKSLIRTYGKFWCTWQTDRGDTLPMGPPALMISVSTEDDHQGFDHGKGFAVDAVEADFKPRHVSPEPCNSTKSSIDQDI